MIEPLPIYMQMRFLFLQNMKKTFLCISRNIFQFFSKVPFLGKRTDSPSKRKSVIPHIKPPEP